MSKPHCLAFFLLLVLGVSSCKVESLDDPIIVPVIDQEFAFEMWQNLDSGEEFPLEIRMYTLEDYECLNTAILSNFARTGRTLEFTLFDILDPEVCDPGLGPATGVQVLSDIEQDLYRLKIELQDIVSNEGWLTVNDDSYVISMDNENGISWHHYEMRRIPKDALWGYVTYTESTNQQAAENFVEELSNISNESNLFDGYYGHFSLSDTGTKLALHTATVGAEALSFVFSYEGNHGLIDQRVEAFLSEAEPGVKIQLWDGEGNEWGN